jgi:NitT/TauT family transport system substrate-binding protein
MTDLQTRRQVLTTLVFGSLAGILPSQETLSAEPPAEITAIRLSKFPAICFAPQYVCEELLRAEGFSDIHYLDTDGSAIPHDLGRGKFDFATSLAMQHIAGIDAGAPITIVSGVHAGCYELFAQPGVRGIVDLKGKKVGLTATPELMQMMAAYVGLDPKKDFTLVSGPEVKPLELFAEGKLDAYLALRRSRRNCTLAESAM